jgi:glycosyltransferase involved in cell wall biosynthesis
MISIIIPTYNRADQLSCCLGSILVQTFNNFEVVAVNDGSTDKTLDVLKDFKNKFKENGFELKIIDQENKGAPNARNHGFQAAKGDYVLFCDSDTVLEKNCLWEMVNTLQNNPEASYVYSSFYWGKKLFKLQAFDGKKLRQMPYINTVSLIRTEHFPNTGWDENLKKFQDWDLWLTMMEEEHRGIWLDKILFRICPGGTMSNWLPSLAYKIFPFIPAVRKYREAVRIIKEKHGLLLPKK